MKVSINKETITFIGKLKEECKMVAIVDLMSEEINSLTWIEHFGVNTGHDMVEISLCYASDEITVKDVKESYSGAKKAA